MAHSFLIFDFGGNEDGAQQARHRIDGWKQGFRLDKKLQLKFDRNELAAGADASPKEDGKSSKAKAGSKAKSKSEDKTGQESELGPAEIRMIVRLDFSDHEKLSHQRWLERIPGEEPFKTANPKIIRVGDPEFESTSKKFDSLD